MMRSRVELLQGIALTNGFDRDLQMASQACTVWKENIGFHIIAGGGMRIIAVIAGVIVIAIISAVGFQRIQLAYYEPRSIQVQLFGNVVARDWTRQTIATGFKDHWNEWYYEMTPELCSRLPKKYDCRSTKDGKFKLNCAGGYDPVSCPLISVTRPDGITIGAAVAGRELIIEEN
jgi:hypothetical protein